MNDKKIILSPQKQQNDTGMEGTNFYLIEDEHSIPIGQVFLRFEDTCVVITWIELMTLYRGLAKLTGMNVSVISHMCAGTQKRFNEKTIQKLESVLEISIPDISNDAEAIIKDMEEGQRLYRYY